MQYMKYFKDSWQELCDLANNGTFTPHQEQDIVCMMYHLCLQKLGNPTRIHASSTWNYDLILGRLKAIKQKDQRISHCLIVEFKFILKKGRKNKRLKEALEDIQRLSTKGNPTVRRVFALFDNTSCMTAEEIKTLTEYKDNVTVLFGPENK